MRIPGEDTDAQLEIGQTLMAQPERVFARHGTRPRLWSPPPAPEQLPGAPERPAETPRAVEAHQPPQSSTEPVPWGILIAIALGGPAFLLIGLALSSTLANLYLSP